MKKHFLIAVYALLLSSCMGITSITTPQSAIINQANFKFIRTASASTTTCYFLGIGGLSKEENADVVEKLIEKAELQQNQALTHIRIETTQKYFLGIVTTRTLTASATVVEFFNPESTSEKSESQPSSPSPREEKLARLREINKHLSQGTNGNIEAIISEINDIDEWYKRNGCYKLAEWNELKKAKDFLKKE